MENLEELVLSESHVKAVRLQDKLGKQNFHAEMREVFELVTNTVKETSETSTRTISETYITNNKATENLNGKVLELMNDKCMIAPYLASSLVNLFIPENKCQFRLIKDINLSKMKDFLINDGRPVTLYSNMLTFRESNKTFILDGDLLETLTSYDLNVGHSNPQDQKLIYEFEEEMRFNIRQKGRKSDRDKSMIRLPKSSWIMASGVSRTIFLSLEGDEPRDRRKL